MPAPRHVVVTGATGALGRAVVAHLLEEGATCHLPMLEAAPPPDLPAGPRVHAAPGVSLTDEAAVTAFFADLPALAASIHCAGGFAMAPVTETSLAAYQAMHDLNAITCFLSCREAVRTMRRGGAGGRIVNVISRAALEPGAGSLAYTAAKAEVAAITRALAAEVVGEGILVNAVAPAILDTPANRAAMPDADRAAWAAPAEVARAIAWLASPANTLTAGALVPVYGRA
jgi:NAD(P)-dependent dehydrogenase (short-subunit alcohol dehydrogenase family)